MFPLPIIGIALGGRMLLSRYGDNFPSGKNMPVFKPVSQRKPMPAQNLTMANPLQAIATPIQTIVRGLTSSLSQLTVRNTGEDYNSILKNFIPDNTKLISSRYPSEGKNFFLSDIDGDSDNELIASYRHNDGIKTIILKKNNGNWSNIGEAINPKCDELNYRDTVSISDDESKCLLLGFSSRNEPPVLYGYSFNEGKLSRIFSHEYNRFDLSNPSGSRDSKAKSNLIFWEKGENDQFRINTFQWDGQQLKQIDNEKNYYSRKVVPYYVSKARQSPYNPSGWYNLAESLLNSGERNDANTAVEVGMSLNPDSPLKDRFTELKSRI